MATPRAWVNILAHSSLTTESGDERSYGLVSFLTHAEEGYTESVEEKNYDEEGKEMEKERKPPKSVAGWI